MKPLFIRVTLAGWLMISLTLLGACAGQPTKPAPTLKGTNWQLVSIEAWPTQFSQKQLGKVTLKLLQKNPNLIGRSSCNQFFTQYSLQQNTLKLSQLNATRRVCKDMTLENTFLNILVTTSNFVLENNQLILMNNQTRLLVFEPFKQEEK